MNHKVSTHNAQSLLRQAVIGAALVTGTVASTAQAAAKPAALQAVPSVDLSRYQGLWYQIAYYPTVFQKQCVSNTTAEYTPGAKGQITVTNTCKTADGSLSTAVGAARIKKPGLFSREAATNAKLEVRFAPEALAWLPLVWAPYWVIQLPDDYRYAVVGEPNRKFLWILSRAPKLSEADRATINATLQQQGYDVSKLQEEPQP